MNLTLVLLFKNKKLSFFKISTEVTRKLLDLVDDVAFNMYNRLLNNKTKNYYAEK